MDIIPGYRFVDSGIFVASFFVVGIFNTRTIQKTKIIDMLSAEKENEPELKRAASFLL